MNTLQNTKLYSLSDFKLFRHSGIPSIYFYQPIDKKIRDSNWPFSVTKQSVFEHLDWYIEETYTHLEDNGSFPESETESKCLLFLINAILLHNEAIIE